MSIRTSVAIAALLTATTWNFTACSRKDEQVKAMQQKAEEAESLDRRLQQAGNEQAKMLAQAGYPNDMSTVQLTVEQKRALEERIRSEKGLSTQALLQEILDKDKEIKGLDEQLKMLRADLPRPVIAKAEDRHLDLAMRFLKAKGVGEAQARHLVSKVFLLEHLEPGNAVYHFFADGQYGTWVAQGQAKMPPTEMARRANEQLTGERDAAIGKADLLQTQIAQLVQTKQDLESEISGIQAEKQDLQQQMERLNAQAAKMNERLNSVHYHVGEIGQLKDAGIIVVPFIGKDRLGPRATDGDFNQDFHLKNNEAAEGIVIRAADAGVKQIRKVHVVPSSLVEDQHYALTLSQDGSTATVRILTPERFRNDKVVFAISG